MITVDFFVRSIEVFIGCFVYAYMLLPVVGDPADLDFAVFDRIFDCSPAL